MLPFYLDDYLGHVYTFTGLSSVTNYTVKITTTNTAGSASTSGVFRTVPKAP